MPDACMVVVRLAEEACWELVQRSRHGVLGTVHPERGVDAVPVVYAVVGTEIVIPIDTVKPKSGGRLSRLANIERDPRVVLLVDRYEDDWSRLWWVRVHAAAAEAPLSDRALDALATRHPVYRVHGSITSTIVLTPQAITGWAAAEAR